MKTKLMLLIILSLHPLISNALKTIIKPDMSSSRGNVVEKERDLLDQLAKNKDKLDNIKLGSLYGKIGMFYQAHEFNRAAKICYENAIELSPYDYRWYHLLGFVEASMGMFDDAKQSYKKVLEVNQNYLPAKVRWAEQELDQGEFEKAVRLLKEVLKVKPKHARALVDIGKIYMQSGKPKKAIEKYQEALKLQPSALQLNYLISQAYASVGNKEQAEKYLSMKGTKEVYMYDEVLQKMHLHSVSPSYYAQSAINSFMNLDYNLAEKLVNRAIELDPEDVNIKLIKLNIILTTRGNKEAVDFAKKLNVKYAANERVIYSMAMLHEIIGDDKTAIKWYRKVTTLNGANKSYHILLAKALMREKQYKEALKELRASNKLEGDNTYATYAEAVLLSHFKICDKSIDKFYDAISKKPKSFTYLIAFVKTVASCNISDKKIISDAMNAAKNLYITSPSIRATQALAMIEAAYGNKQEAVDFQRQVLFQAVSQKLPKYIFTELKKDLERYKNGKPPTVPFKYFDDDLNPEKSYGLYR